MLERTLSIIVLVVIFCGGAKADERSNPQSQKPLILLAQAQSDRARAFRGPKFNQNDSLERQRKFLRKKGFSHPGFIEMMARDKVDRSWNALVVRADRQMKNNDFRSAVATYDKILASLHPDHLLARLTILSDKLIAIKRIGYLGHRLTDVVAEDRNVKKQICALQVEGYRGMKGYENQARYKGAKSCLKNLGGGETYIAKPKKKNRCHKDNFAKLSDDAKGFFNLACNNNFSFSRTNKYSYIDLTRYIKDEDGAVAVLRTGYEVELYKALKERYLDLEFYDPLPMSHIFTVAVHAILKKERSNNPEQHVVVNVLDALMTAHNVTRLLARPEQWAGNYPMTYAGQNRIRDDAANPILEDLMGRRSVDQYPTFLQHYGGNTYFDFYKIIDAFFGTNGVYEFDYSSRVANDSFNPDHWNAGIHYYFWVGSVIQWIGNYTTAGYGGGKIASEGAYFYENMQKMLQGVGLRGELQLKHGFTPGVNVINRFISILNELERLDPAFISK